MDARPLCHIHPLFLPHGTIPIAFFNVPGSVHDSQVAEFGNIYKKLEDVYLSTGAKCCIDSAFSNVTRDYLHKSCQDVLGSSAPTHRERLLDLQKKREATSARADSRVGNAWIAGFFPLIEGSICIQRERIVENNIEVAGVAL